MDFERLKLAEGNYWSVFLHQDQTSIGKSYFWYKGKEKDLLDVPPDALIEFQELGRKTKSSLDKLFRPDLYNYQSLNNLTKHLHVHMIPRYSQKIEMFGRTFEDSSFGSAYSPNISFKLDEEILVKLCDLIKGNI